MPTERDIKYEAGDYFVLRLRGGLHDGSFAVYRNGTTCATLDSAYADLSLAVARCKYLARPDRNVRES